jgi:hypothetical protein
MLVGERNFPSSYLYPYSYPTRFFRLFFSLLSLLKNPIYMGVRIPIIHKVYVKSRHLSRVFKKKSSRFYIHQQSALNSVSFILPKSCLRWVWNFSTWLRFGLTLRNALFNACRGEKFSVFIPLSLFLPNPVFQAIFFSLIFAQKPYIYGRTDSHHT